MIRIMGIRDVALTAPLNVALMYSNYHQVALNVNIHL